MKKTINVVLALAVCGGLSVAAQAEEERANQQGQHYVPVVDVIALDADQAARLRDERERQKQERARLRDEHRRNIQDILGS